MLSTKVHAARLDITHRPAARALLAGGLAFVFLACSGGSTSGSGGSTAGTGGKTGSTGGSTQVTGGGSNQGPGGGSNQGPGGSTAGTGGSTSGTGGGTGTGGAERVPQRQSDFMPIGLYWAGEFVWRDAADQPDWAKVDVALTDMAKRSVNALWITHLTATQTAEMARRAAAHSIYLVASIAEMDFTEPYVRGQDHQELIQRVVQAWGDAPKPIAWGLGDEPRTEYMSEMASYVQKWRTFAPGEPVTTVVMYHDLDAAAALRFDALSADIYPFFSADNPNRYGIPEWEAWTVNSRRLVAISPKPWMMGQSFQEPWGPYEVDTVGNIFYLPGGAPLWVFPTPEQISWQALSTFATGSKGMFYFHYRNPTSGDPNAAATDLPAAVQTRTDSKAPRAMVYADGRPTLQYDAMSEAFSWIAKRRSILAPLKESKEKEAWEVEPAKVGGNVVSMLVDPATQKRWLMVVASYDQPVGEPVRFLVAPRILGLEAAANGTERAILKVAGSFRSGEVLLAPGTAALFSCSVDGA